MLQAAEAELVHPSTCANEKKGMILLVAYTSNDKHVLTFTECLLSCLATVTQR